MVVSLAWIKFWWNFNEVIRKFICSKIIDSFSDSLRVVSSLKKFGSNFYDTFYTLARHS